MKLAAITVSLLCALALASSVTLAVRLQSAAVAPVSEAMARVGEAGVHIIVGRVAVDAPATVAPPGTTLRARIVGPPPTTGAGAIAGAVGTGIELELDGGRQPAAPVTITFPSTVAYTVDQPSAIRAIDDLAPFVLTRPADGSEPTLVPARVDPATHAVTVQVEHFSTFWEKAATARDMLAGITGALAGATPKPACAGQPLTLAGAGKVAVTGPAGDGAWVCARLDGDAYAVDLTNNSPVPWEMRASPRATLLPQGATKLPDVLAIAVAQPRNMLPPGGSATYRFPLDAFPSRIELTADPGTLLVSDLAVALDVVAAVFGVSWAEHLGEVGGSVGCLTSTVGPPGNALDVATVGTALRALLACLGPAAQQMEADTPVMGVVLAIVGSGVELVVPGIAGAAETVQGPARITLSAAATRTVVIEPVDADGTPVTGWTVEAADDPVECGPASAGGIVECTPFASGGAVCWPEPDAGSVLCLRDAWSRTLDRHPATGADVAVDSPATASPIGLELVDGTRCRLRYGGAWSPRADDENLTGAYSCGGTNEQIVWSAGDNPIDRSSSTWTVRVGTAVSPLRTVAVRVAYVAATA